MDQIWKTTLTIRGQTAVPVRLRKALGLKPHQELEWTTNGQLIYVLPVAKDPIKAFRGSGRLTTKTMLHYRQQARRQEHAAKHHLGA